MCGDKGHGERLATSRGNGDCHRLRLPVTIHCLAAFAFNIGVLAFTINVLGSG
jgi:hypothetical protein